MPGRILSNGTPPLLHNPDVVLWNKRPQGDPPGGRPAGNAADGEYLALSPLSLVFCPDQTRWTDQS